MWIKVQHILLFWSVGGPPSVPFQEISQPSPIGLLARLKNLVEELHRSDEIIYSAKAAVWLVDGEVKIGVNFEGSLT